MQIKVIDFNNCSDVDFVLHWMDLRETVDVNASNFDFEKAETGRYVFYEAMLNWMDRR